MSIILDNFMSLDIRVGRIVQAILRSDLRNPAIQLSVDFGEEFGVLTTSAQVSDLYNADTLVGTLVGGLVNIPSRQIANIISQCLILGFETDKGVVLMTPERDLPLGSKLA